jgi:hypothetical protein
LRPIIARKRALCTEKVRPGTGREAGLGQAPVPRRPWMAGRGLLHARFDAHALLAVGLLQPFKQPVCRVMGFSDDEPGTVQRILQGS